MGWGGAGQFGLDLLASSEIPVVSQVAGVASAGIYAAQGDSFGASTSLLGLAPVAGIAADATRLGRWADKISDAVKNVHGNSKLSQKSQHVYEIRNIQTGEIETKRVRLD